MRIRPPDQTRGSGVQINERRVPSTVATRQAQARTTTASKTKTLPVRRKWRRTWLWITAAMLVGPSIIITGVIWYYYVTLSKIIDERLHGVEARTFPRIFARPFELHRGRSSQRPPTLAVNTMGPSTTLIRKLIPRRVRPRCAWQ